MRTPRHRMPAESFLAVARGGGGSTTIDRLLAARHSRNLLSLRAVVDLAVRQRHPDAAPALHAWQQLGVLRAAHPAAARRILLYPTVGVWLADTFAALRSTDPARARPAALAQVAAAVAMAAGASVRVEFPTRSSMPGRLALPALGHVLLPPATSAIRLEVAAGAVTVDDGPADGTSWSSLPRLHAGGGLDVRLDQLWSLVDPALAGPVSRAETTALHTSLAAAWRVLTTNHRRHARALAAAITMIMPVPARSPTTDDTDGLVSGTHPDGAGCVALSAGGDPPSVAAALVHELQHSKLAALADLFPLVRSGHDLRLHAPWRPDPRPLPALVQGLYAHAGVLGFWYRQWHREPHSPGVLHAQVEFGRLRSACRRTAEALLATDGLTVHGRLLVTEIRRAVAHWQRVPVPRTALAIARRAGERPGPGGRPPESRTGDPVPVSP
ncbi:HEXXH motif-containing putative peptide modification protein [Verrucosispora sp. WMMD1129]|uniref:aKG-HExxH-type peptide beta-hydroxylase n=1 Tax=Verrucosispora sp. WMMD1129 TaxID=3016093 RepID=UPI00249BCBF8|nr:HEXXH motif-containing putative peptide modification protein [Verrucosispora sp. WMMD1129]WFE44883.1 HEXXH motif-containing putative peptide modification protein [Verrucosispora sp. WMMD1129]